MPRPIRIARGYLSEEECIKLLNNTLDPEERLLWLVMLDMGLRISEALQPTIADCLSTSIRINGKAGAYRHIPTTARVREGAALLRRLGFLASRRVTTLRPRAIQDHFKRALKRAEIFRPGLSPHTLRHTYATRLLRQGIDLTIIQILLGHSSLQTTASYLHLSDDHMKQASAALDQANEAAQRLQEQPPQEDPNA